MVTWFTRFKCRVVVGSPGKRLPRPLHPVLLYFSHASKQERKFSSQFFHFLIVTLSLTWKLFFADFQIYEDDPPLSEKALDGWSGGAKTLMSPIKPAPTSGLRGSNKPVPSYCNWGRLRTICGPLGSGQSLSVSLYHTWPPRSHHQTAVKCCQSCEQFSMPLVFSSVFTFLPF